MKMNKTREQVIDHILSGLKKGEIPFQKKWMSVLPFHNPVSGSQYRGINRIQLAFVSASRGLDDPRWLTFNQATNKGWKIKKGAKGVPVEYWSYYDTVNKKILDIHEAQKLILENENMKDIIVPMSKTYTVFNAVDIEGIPPYKISELNKQDIEDSLAYKVLMKYLQNESIPLKYNDDKAFYSIHDDSISMPSIHQFKSEYDYLSVLAHEECHSTGAEHRMNRNIANVFGTEKYAIEELRAEIGSVMLCADLSLEQSQYELDNHQAYINSWMKVIEEQPNEIFKAINDAQKISDFVLEHGEIELYKMAEIPKEKNLILDNDSPNINKSKSLTDRKKQVKAKAKENMKMRKDKSLDKVR